MNNFRRQQPFAKGRTIRPVPGLMNKTEKRYSEHLELRRIAREILQWGFEELTFKLAKDLRYTPDFWLQLPDGTIELHEVKAGAKHTIKNKQGVKVATGKTVPRFEDDAKVRVRITAAKFPFRLVVVFEDKTTHQWLTEEYVDLEKSA